MTDIESSREIEWNPRLEEYFSQTAEKAHCFSWLHKRAEELFSRLTVWIDLPVIVLGVLNGAVSIGSKGLFGDTFWAPIAIGCVALLTSILTTITTYFGWGRRAEGHKISSVQYAKLYRFIRVELCLPRRERTAPATLMKYCKDQYDRLAETSPLVPSSVLQEFRRTFAHITDISFPEEAHGLTAVEVYEQELAHTPRQHMYADMDAVPHMPVQPLAQALPLHMIAAAQAAPAIALTTRNTEPLDASHADPTAQAMAARERHDSADMSTSSD